MIKVNNLAQTYSSGKGVFNLDFNIGGDGVFDYLGPNGAGKTATIRNLMGFVNPDNGDSSCNRLDPLMRNKLLSLLTGENRGARPY
jgi:ABC-2 type transport system ATP-binding protein